MKKYKGRIKLSFWVGLLISMTFCAFGPLEMIMSNTSEFWFSVTDVLPYIGLTMFLCWGVVFLASFLISFKTAMVYPVLLGIGLALYVQGNFMFVSYGVMDGTPIDWNSFGAWPILNTLIWVLLIAAPVALYKFKKRWLREAAVWLPAVVVAMQVITLTTVALAADFSENAQSGDMSLTVKGIDEVSEKGNVALFVLDTFEDTFFEEILTNEPEYLEPLDGFTYFSNNTGLYPTTKGAMPFILSGEIYRNEQPYSEYVRQAYTKTDYYKDLVNAGYEIGIYGEMVYINSEAIREYIVNLDTASGVKASSDLGLMGTIYKATAFRYLPHIAKKAAWYYSGDFDDWKTTTGASGYALYKTGNLDLYNEIKQGELHLTDSDKGSYKVFYAYGCHPPYKLRPDMTETTDGSVTQRDVAKACLNIVYEYVEQLKELDVYDQSTIVVIADHGRTDVNFTSPLLLVKPRNASGSLQISDAPVSQMDLLATIMEDLGLNEGNKYGCSSFGWQEGEERARTFLFYDWANKGSWTDDVLPEIVEYSIPSHTNDPSSFLPLNYEKEAYALGTVLGFSVEDPTIKPYCIYGMSGFEPNCSWLIKDRACFAFEIGEDIQKDLEVEINVANVYGPSQHVTITYGGYELFNKEMTHAEPISFTIPAEKITDGEIELLFDLPDAVSPYELGESDDTRTLSLSIASMVIREAEEGE